MFNRLDAVTRYGEALAQERARIAEAFISWPGQCASNRRCPGHFNG